MRIKTSIVRSLFCGIIFLAATMVFAQSGGHLMRPPQVICQNFLTEKMLEMENCHPAKLKLLRQQAFYPEFRLQNHFPPPIDHLSKSSTGSWISLGPEGGWIGTLLMHPTDHNILYALTYNSYPTQFFKSINGGGTWNCVSSIPDYIYSAAIDPNNPSVFYAACGMYMYKSIDSGLTWSRNQIATVWPYISNISVCPTNSNIIYAAGYYSDTKSIMVVYKTINGGNDWTSFVVSPPGDQAGWANCFAVSPADPNVLYIGGERYDGYTYAGGLFKSTDGGANWSDIYTGISGYLYAIAIDPTAQNKIYIGTSSGVYRSSDSGTNWTMNNGWLYCYELAIDPRNSKILYSGCSGQIFKSTDGGMNWTSYQGGLKGMCYSLLVDHAASNTIYYGSSVGIFKSSNSGVSWSETNTGLITSSITSMAVVPSDPKTLYIEFANNAIFKTTDSGAHWNRLSEFLACGNIGALAVNSTSPNITYALEGSG